MPKKQTSLSSVWPIIVLFIGLILIYFLPVSRATLITMTAAAMVVFALLFSKLFFIDLKKGLAMFFGVLAILGTAPILWLFFSWEAHLTTFIRIPITNSADLDLVSRAEELSCWEYSSGPACLDKLAVRDWKKTLNKIELGTIAYYRIKPFGRVVNGYKVSAEHNLTSDRLISLSKDKDGGNLVWYYLPNGFSTAAECFQTIDPNSTAIIQQIVSWTSETIRITIWDANRQPTCQIFSVPNEKF